MISANTKHSVPFKGKRSQRLAVLKRQISQIESYDSRVGDAEMVDHDVAGELPPLIGKTARRPALHELVASTYLDQPAVREFTLALIAFLMQEGSLSQKGHQGMVLWCQRRMDSAEFGNLYGPGLKALGLPPECFLIVTGNRDTDCLWAMEQGLASRSFLAVVGAVDHISLVASRRLSLAARAHDTFCFLLPIHQGQEPSAARTRWRVRSAPSTPDHLDRKSLGLPTWKLNLERSPTGRIGHWTVEWDHAAHHFHLSRRQSSTGRSRADQEDGDIIAFERAG